MRRCDIITGILLILSISDFALAAPVSVQEKRQARVDVVHIPKDLTTVLGKRWDLEWDEELGKLGEEYSKTSGKPVESSGTHSSSSSTPSGPEPSTNDVTPAPNLASSTPNPDQLMEASCSPSSSSTSSIQGLRARGNCFGNLLKLWNDPLSFKGLDPVGGPMTYIPSSPGYGADYVMTVPGVHLGMHAPQPYSNSRPPINPSKDNDFDWDLWSKAEDRPSPPSPKRLGQGHNNDDDGASTSGHAPGPPPRHSDSSWPGPPRTEFYSTTTVSADYQTVDLPTADYEGRGKAVMGSRRVSSTARGIGNAAQREFQPSESA